MILIRLSYILRIKVAIEKDYRFQKIFLDLLERISFCKEIEKS